MEKMSDSGQNTKPKFDTETKLKLLISLINDEGKSKLEASLDKLVGRLFENLDKYESVIRKYLVKSILHIPMKTGIYASFFHRLYVKSEKSEKMMKFIQDVFIDLATFISDYSEEESDNVLDDPLILLRYVRFIFEAFTNHILNLESLKEFIDQLLDEKRKENERIVFLNLIILNLPFFYEKLKGDDAKYFQVLIERIDSSVNIYESSSIFKFNEKTGKSLKNSNQDYLSLVWGGIKSAILNNFTSKYILSFKNNQKEEISDIKVDFNLNISDSLLTSSYAEFIYNEDVFSFSPLQKEFSNYDTSNNFYDRVILRTYSKEILKAFSNKMSLCVLYLNNIPQFFGIVPDNIYINYNQDDLSDNKEATLVNYVIFDTIFTEILQVKRRNQSEVKETTFLSSLIFNLKKGNSSSTSTRNKISSEFLLAITKNISQFTVGSIDRFSNSLAFLLPNQQMKFNWQMLEEMASNMKNGSDSLEGLKLNQLLNTAMTKLHGLTGSARLEEIMSKDYPWVMRFVPVDSDKPKWKFTANEQFYADAEKIISLIKNKAAFSSWNENFESKANDFTYIFISCLLYTRHKTLTHMRETLNFYLDEISKQINSPERQIVLLNALFDVWGHSSIFLKFLLEFFFNNNLLDHILALKYIFTQFLLKSSTKSENILNPIYIEMSLYTAGHTEKLMERLRRDLSKEQETLANSDETTQADVIKKIEALENRIEKLSGEADLIATEMIGYYFVLYSKVQKDKALEAYVKERIVQVCREFKVDLLRNFEEVQKQYAEVNEKLREIEYILENIKLI